MRDTSDMMEDALSEDTMMDCTGDGGGLGELVDLATDVADSSPTIRDAAERLLTLLGVEDEEEDDDDFFSSSEDEGVEVDVDELEDDEDEDDHVNTRLLHQLAASLAQELKYSQQKQTPNNSTRLLQGRHSFETRDNQIENMGMIQDTSCLGYSYLSNQMDFKEETGHYREHGSSNQNDTKHFPFGNFRHEDRANSLPSRAFVGKEVSSLVSSGLPCLDGRLRMDEETQEGRSSNDQEEEVPASWGAGWDACATEALRYLVEDEGLPPHHPTVLAMKNHLDLQRERAFAQYTA